MYLVVVLHSLIWFPSYAIAGATTKNTMLASLLFYIALGISSINPVIQSITNPEIRDVYLAAWRRLSKKLITPDLVTEQPVDSVREETANRSSGLETLLERFRTLHGSQHSVTHAQKISVTRSILSQVEGLNTGSFKPFGSRGSHAIVEESTHDMQKSVENLRNSLEQIPKLAKIKVKIKVR